MRHVRFFTVVGRFVIEDAQCALSFMKVDSVDAADQQDVFPRILYAQLLALVLGTLNMDDSPTIGDKLGLVLGKGSEPAASLFQLQTDGRPMRFGSKQRLGDGAQAVIEEFKDFLLADRSIGRSIVAAKLTQREVDQ